MSQPAVLDCELRSLNHIGQKFWSRMDCFSPEHWYLRFQVLNTINQQIAFELLEQHVKPLEVTSTSWMNNCWRVTVGEMARDVYLVGKGLWWIINDDGLWQISAQNVEVLDVVPLDAHAMLAKQPVSTVTQDREGLGEAINQWQGQRGINNSEEPRRWQSDADVCHYGCSLRSCSASLFSALAAGQRRSHLTSCFLGSKMLSSLSAYTFLDAVKRMICSKRKITLEHQICFLIYSNS